MKKLLIFPVLGLAFFPFLTSAQSSDSPLCQDCLSSYEYLSCVGGQACYDVNGDDYCRESPTCEGMWGDDWAALACDDVYAECESDDDDYCQGLRDACFVDFNSRYNSCVATCQFNDCGLGICLPMSGGEGGDSGDGGHGSSPIVGGVLDGTQISNMGTALTNGGSSLLRIGIQLLPYAIAFTIILLIFGLIKNWSKLKNKWSSGKTYGSINEYSEDYWVGINKKKGKKTYVTDDDLSALNFYHDDYKKYNPGSDIYSSGKYYRTKNGKIALNWKSKGKSYTEYYDDDAILFDILPDEEHHYKKRYGLYNH